MIFTGGFVYPRFTLQGGYEGLYLAEDLCEKNGSFGVY